MSKFRFKNRRKTKKGALAMAKSNRRKISGLKNRIENKYNLNSMPLTAMASNPESIVLTDSTEGVQFDERIGNVIHGQFLMVNINFRNLADDFAQTVRLMIFKDRQPNSALATDGDLLQESSAAGFLTSLKNVTNMDRFHILYDRYFNLSNIPGVAGQPIDQWSLRLVKIRIPLHNLKIRYNKTNSGTIADSIENAIVMRLWTSAGTEANIGWQFSARLTFKDS